MSEQKGVLQEVFEAVKVSEKFTKRMFILNTAGDYPQEIEFQLSQNNCGLIDAFGIGQEINVNYNLRGRKWTNPQGEDKYFNTLDVWKIEQIGEPTNQPNF